MAHLASEIGSSHASKALPLLEKAVVINLQQGRYGQSRKVETADSVDSGDGQDAIGRLRVTKKILDHPKMDAIRKFDVEVSKRVKALCAPGYIDEGFWFLSLDKVAQVDQMLEGDAAARELLVIEASEALPEIVANDERDLGEKYFNAADYPNMTEFLEKFSMSWRYLAFTTPEILKESHPDIYEKNEEKQHCRILDTSEEMRLLMRQNFVDLFARLQERLDGTRETKNGEIKVKIFRDTLLTNATDFLSSFAFRNLTEDAELEMLVEEAKVILGSVTAEALRKDEAVRTQTKEAVDYLVDTGRKLIEGVGA